MNFDNPVYRKTTEDHFSLEKNLPANGRMYPNSIVEDEVSGSTFFISILRHDNILCFEGQIFYNLKISFLLQYLQNRIAEKKGLRFIFEVFHLHRKWFL